MNRSTLLACTLLSLLSLAGPAPAADTAEVEQLREQLRSTVLQLRQLQDQQAAAPAPAAAADDAALKAKLATAQSRLGAARRAAAAAAGLQAALTKAQADNAALTASAVAAAAERDKYKAAYNQAVEAQRALAAERDKLKGQLSQTSGIAAACQAKNARLIAFAETLLAADRKIGFSQVLAAREPVLGLRRVQLENIAQDREDTVRANRCDARIDFESAKSPGRTGP